MAKLNFIKPNVVKPNRVTPNRVSFEPDRFEPEEIPLTAEQEEKVQLIQDIHELNERNLKALDRFRASDDEMYKLTLDNMMMLTRLGIRALKT